MKLQKVTDPAFKKYGKVVTNVDFSQLVEELKKTPCPEGVVYEPSVESLEALPVYQALQDVSYGEMPIQIGYCNGHNEYLNALEYHFTSIGAYISNVEIHGKLDVITDAEKTLMQKWIKWNGKRFKRGRRQ